MIATQVTQLAADLPGYEANMRAKIQSLRGSAAANNTLERAADVLQDLGKELNKPRMRRPPGYCTAVGRLAGPRGQADTCRGSSAAAFALESIASLLAPLLKP